MVIIQFKMTQPLMFCLINEKLQEEAFFFCFQLKKAMELNEQLRQRMGVVIVGPSGAGKSTLWRMLRAALNMTGKVVRKESIHLRHSSITVPYVSG